MGARPPLSFEDLRIGDEYTSPGRTVTEADIVVFAGISGVLASSIITITRPALGAAAALGVYAIAVSGVLNIDFDNEEQAHLTVLALAFASGFSERLVVRAVGAATGAAEDGKKR